MARKTYYTCSFVNLTVVLRQTWKNCELSFKHVLLTSSSYGKPPVSNLEKTSCPLISISKLPIKTKEKIK